MKGKGLRHLVLIVLSILTSMTAEAQNLTLSNNLLYDATLTPNLRLAMRLSPQWSLGLTAGYRPWPTDDQATRKYKHLLLSPDLRYWTDSVNVHHFFGFNLVYAHYNVGSITFPLGFWKSVRDERQQGDFIGLGAYYGYSWPLGRHWNFEAFIGAAVGYNKYDRYECAHCGAKIGTEKKVAVLPQAGLNIVFNIPGRPRKQESESAVLTQPVVEVSVANALVEKPFVARLSPVDEMQADSIQQQSDKVAATINEASELLTTDCGDCHREALRLLQTVRNDERAQNALGVALWLNGQKDEALNCFRRAAANGNKDAQENLKSLNEI